MDEVDLEFSNSRRFLIFANRDESKGLLGFKSIIVKYVKGI